MTPQHAQQNVVAGDTWVMPFTCVNAAGTAFDLTGATLSWEMVDDETGVSALTAVPTPGDDPTKGIATVTVAAASSADLPAGFYRDSLVATKDGVVTTLSQGPIAVFSGG